MTSLNPVKRIGEQIATRASPEARARSRRRAQAAPSSSSPKSRSAIRGACVDLYPHELSGGMRQRILIAIAFACRPRLVIADEPTTALDVTVQRQILRLIHDLQHRQGSAVLFVTHNFGLVAKLCQSVTVLYAGRVVEDGRGPRRAEPRRATPIRAALAEGDAAARPAGGRAGAAADAV